MAKPRGSSFLDLEGHYDPVWGSFWQLLLLKKAEKLRSSPKQAAFQKKSISSSSPKQLPYHSNPVNVCIHEIFVWPIFLTALLLLHLTALFPHAAGVGAAIYGAYYILLDRRAGALAALLCLLCWTASGALAARLGFSLGWKVVLVSQLFCWTMQFIGHGVFEKRAPALLDNLVQAFLMAPFFVLLEVLHTFAGYEPYPGFHAKVSKLIEEARKEWEDEKSKKSS
ncbi:2-hydroxy-palmitic acid dioxygenase MPO1-like [Phragmites australis]|uniref:2-hydroxy-palmitic acid dioxygenase MPO1-like n=1 Tax=Phragmites australis TaxID=29695 RepID=UPI002D796353|nr:2-hydroxy-palmitic acid dioxygenase MPO1-like [Phragmites australis]